MGEFTLKETFKMICQTMAACTSSSQAGIYLLKFASTHVQSFIFFFWTWRRVLRRKYTEDYLWVSKCGMFATVLSSIFIGNLMSVPIGNFIIIASSKTKQNLLNAKMIQSEVDWLIAYPVNSLLVWWVLISRQYFVAI